MADPKRMSENVMTEAQARAVIKDYEHKERIRERVRKKAKERGDPPPSGPVFRPRTPPGGSAGSPLQSRKQYYDNARAALKYHEDKRAAFQKRYVSPPARTRTPPPTTVTTPLPTTTTTPLPTTTTTPSPTDEEFRSLLDRLGVERPVKKAKGGLIKSRKKSSRKKSIDGIARRGKTKGTLR